jgi:hypothetical protein
MKTLKRSLLIGLVITALSSVGVASTCQTVTADNIAADDGCTLTNSLTFPGPTTLTFSNFTFVLGTVTAPGGFAAKDNTISFSVGVVSDKSGNWPSFTVTDTGDSLWDISSGEWGFTLKYTVTASIGQVGPLMSFAASQQGSSATGTGGSRITGTIDGLTSTATTAAPDPPFLRVPFSGSLNVTDVVLNDAGSGTSNLTSVSNTFVTPEPMTSILFGSGLLALGLIARLRAVSPL